MARRGRTSVPARTLIATLLLWAAVTVLAGHVDAAVDVHRFDDPAREQRYRDLISELRCLVCQNQNLADSNADLAQDLRQKVYEMIQAGAGDDEILDFMVARYGDFVLYRPPLRSTTILLWAGPFLLLASGVTIVVVFVRRRRATVAAGVSREQRDRVRRLLDGEAGEPR
jgi:cytochrome c-type biogenesis protein CcmH